MKIYCCGCNKDVDARLTSGAEIYPHLPKLTEKPIWKCDACGGYVGCHHKTVARTKPLGTIPTPELRKVRQDIHKALDPLWRGDYKSRSQLYALLAKKLQVKEYHTAEVNSLAQADKIMSILKEISAGYCEHYEG